MVAFLLLPPSLFGGTRESRIGPGLGGMTDVVPCSALRPSARVLGLYGVRFVVNGVFGVWRVVMRFAVYSDPLFSPLLGKVGV